MAKPAKSLSERKKELIDDQEYLSEKEKKKAKEEVEKTEKIKASKKEETRKILEEEQKEFKKAAEKSAAGEDFVLFKDEDFEKDDKDESWYKEFEKGLKEEREYLSFADRAKQSKSDTVFNTYNTGEEWLMSEGEDDLAKGFINNFRSAIGTGVEDFAYWLNDNAPWYKPAETVLEKNTAGKIEEQAQRNFGNAKANGVNGNVVDFLDSTSKGLGYGVLGLKAGGYIQDGAEAFDEYRNLRESGYSKDEATFIMAKKAPMYILSVKADDYIGKNSRVDGVLYGKSGIVDKTDDILPDATKKSTINLDMQFFAEKDLEKQSSTSLKRGIRSLNKEVELHKEKLKNPQNYDEDWKNRSEREKAGLLRHWRKEISNQEESINNRIEELRKRGENYD